MGDSTVSGPASVTGTATGTVDGVQISFRVGAAADLTCVRCLTVWSEALDVEASQHFSPTPDDDGYAIVVNEGVIEVDVGAPVIDELSLAIPPAPVCRQDCAGICPTCGTDMNTNPCDGHRDETESPFEALRDLFE